MTMNNRKKEELMAWYYHKILYLKADVKIEADKVKVKVKDRSQSFMDQEYRIENEILVPQPERHPEAYHYIFVALADADDLSDLEKMHKLREYYLDLNFFDPEDFYAQEIMELEEQGHKIISVKPCLVDHLFCIVECHVSDIRYWVHFDDGDALLTRSEVRPWGHPHPKTLGIMRSDILLIPSVNEVLEYYG